VCVDAIRPRHYETLEWLEMSVTSKVKVLLIYRPPPSKKNKFSFGGFMRDFSDLLDSYVTETASLTIIGDINIKVNLAGDPETVKYLDLLATHGFTQIVDKPTHRSGNTLDHVIVRDPSRSVPTFTVDPLKAVSDHFRKFRKIDIVAFSSEIEQRLASPDIQSLSDNVMTVYNQVLSSVLDKHAPVTQVQIKGTTKKPWYSDGQYHKTGLEVHRQMFTEQSKRVVALIKKAKVSYFHSKLADCNSRDMFRMVKGILSTDTGGQLPDASDMVELANRFAGFFHDKIMAIHSGFSTLCCQTTASVPCNDSNCLTEFKPVSVEQLQRLIKGSAPKSCRLDPLYASVCFDVHGWSGSTLQISSNNWESPSKYC
jgi:hypothetical protein